MSNPVNLYQGRTKSLVSKPLSISGTLIFQNLPINTQYLF